MQLKLNEIIQEKFEQQLIKLNYNCPAEYKEGEGKGSCAGYDPKNFQKEKKEATKAKKVAAQDKKRGRAVTKTAKTAKSQIKKVLKDPKMASHVESVKGLIAKVAAEKKAGKVSKETYTALKSAMKEFKAAKSGSPKDLNTNPVVSTPSKVVNSDLAVDKMQTGDVWNAGLIGDIRVDEVDDENGTITVTANNFTETMTKGALKKALKEYNVTKGGKGSTQSIDNKISDGIKSPGTATRNVLKMSKIDVAEGETYLRYGNRLRVDKINDDTIEYTEMSNDTSEKKSMSPDNFKEYVDGYVSKFSEIPRVKQSMEIINNEKYKDVIQGYTGFNYIAINKTLLGRELTDADKPDPNFNVNENISVLDDVMSKTAFPEDAVVYSGLGNSATQFIDSVCPHKKCGSGSEFDIKSFVSTTLDERTSNVFHGGKNTLLKIKVPKGSKALSLEDISGFPTEKEILLNRGSKFRVVESKMVGYNAGKHREITVELVNN